MVTPKKYLLTKGEVSATLLCRDDVCAIMICSKAKSETRLEEAAVSWSGDSISVCSKCRMSIWDTAFDDFHTESVMEDDDGNHFFN